MLPFRRRPCHGAATQSEALAFEPAVFCVSNAEWNSRQQSGRKIPADSVQTANLATAKFRRELLILLNTDILTLANQ